MTRNVRKKSKEKRILPASPKIEDPTAKVLTQMWNELQVFRKEVNERLTCIEEYIFEQKKLRKRVWGFAVNVFKRFGVPIIIAVAAYLIGRFFGVEIDGTVNLTYMIIYI